jgi:predicted transcriptional regulator of viral defense system
MKDDSDDILFEIASSQQGYFTSAQAIELGYESNNHAYHVKHGNWLREVRGIYRLAKFPHSPDGQYVIWSLWSRDRQGNVQGVYSHETALSMYDVSDVMPAKLHMTVPNKFRRGTKIPEILVLHKADLTQDDIAQKQGHRVTTPARTLLDIIEEDTQEENIIQQAVREFKTKGMISKKEICRIIEEYPKSARYFI